MNSTNVVEVGQKIKKLTSDFGKNTSYDKVANTASILEKIVDVNGKSGEVIVDNIRNNPNLIFTKKHKTKII